MVNLDTFIEDLKQKIDKNLKKIEDLKKIENKTFNNFVKPLELMEEELDIFFTPLSHLNSVDNSEKTQEVYTNSLPIITQYSTQLSQDLEIYNSFKEIQKQNLDETQSRVVELNIQNFELSGAHLDDETKKELENINIKLSELSNNFSQNLLDATNAYSYIITDEKDLEGLLKSDIESAKFEEDGVTKYKFTLQLPSYLAYMTYGKNEKIREELYKAYVTRAPQNGKIIDEILELKQKMAKLLGFENYASYSIASKMAKDEKSVLDFLQNLLKNSQKQAKDELKELEDFAQKQLKSHDTAYYSELLKQKNYNIDEEVYKPYFELNSVVDGMFTFLTKLFNIEFKKQQNLNENTSVYELHVDGKKRATLYLDLEARESKRGGAWMHNWHSHHIDKDGKEHLASAFVVCNFPPASKTQPSLLRHDDVVTLFHEMGHALHHLLSDVSENGVSGVNGVEWDAVEYPSQFLENFAYESDVLKMFAKHYESGESISDEMVEKLIKSKNFLSAMSMLRQLEFSLFDFKLHQKLYKGKEVQNLLDEIREQTSLIKPPSYNKFQNGFAHIFAGGYSAGYYSYKWAEVLSADTFYSVIDEGVFNSQTAQRYKNIVLKGGGAKSMEVYFKEVMLREIDTNNLLRLNGIKC